MWREAEAEERFQEDGQLWTREQRRAARAHLVTGMQAGQPWQTAAAQAEGAISQLNAYRLWEAFRLHGETAQEDGRHGGYPIKLRGEARTFLEVSGI